MKFKLLITCCYSVVCFCSRAMPLVHLQKAQGRECNKAVLLPNEEQRLSQDLNEMIQSNVVLNHEGKDIVKSKRFFQDSIRNMQIFRKFLRHVHNKITILGVNIEKCRHELQILESKRCELERDIEMAKKKEEELKKNIEMAKKEASVRHVRLKMAQGKAKL